MPEHLRSLVVIVALATVVFAFARAPACSFASTLADFQRRRNLWFAVTLAAFISYNYWVFVIVAVVLLLLTLRRESNKLALFFFLLFAVPPISTQISGIGVIEYFFTIHYVRLLALIVLLPTFFVLWGRPDSETFGRSIPDKLVAGYLLLSLLLQLAVDSFTNTLRHGVFYAFTDIFLPYYVASRSLKNPQGFRDTLMAFLIAGLVLSVIGTFEFAKYWLLYTPLQDALDLRWTFGGYLDRGQGSLRAQASTGHPIALGYVVAVAAGFFLYLQKWLSPMARGVAMVALSAGIIAPLSRGPWVGAMAMIVVFVATGPSGVFRLAKVLLIGLLMVPVLLAVPAGRAMIDLLPFFGSVEAQTITYRQRLLEVSIRVIKQNPFFGSTDYLLSPTMQELMEGGIIDVVNSYLGIALEFGMVGLALFVGVFMSVAAGIVVTMRHVADSSDDLHLLGRALLATLLAILVIIFTVSSISVIPTIYWAVAGLGVAYARMGAYAVASSLGSAASGPQSLTHTDMPRSSAAR